jgi:hypothetical protein
MSIKNNNFGPGEIQVQSPITPPQQMEKLHGNNILKCNYALVAAVDIDLRARIKTANELLKHSSDSLRQTKEMIACSRAAITQSRTVLDSCRSVTNPHGHEVVDVGDRPADGLQTLPGSP